MTPTPDATTIAAQIEALDALKWANLMLHSLGKTNGFSIGMCRTLDASIKREADARNSLSAIVTALRQAEAAPGVVEAERALLIARQWGNHHDSACPSLIVPENEDGPWLECACQLPARMKMIDDSCQALARQHGAREDAAPSADAAMVEAVIAEFNAIASCDGIGSAIVLARAAMARLRALDLASRQPAGDKPGSWGPYSVDPKPIIDKYFRPAAPVPLGRPCGEECNNPKCGETRCFGYIPFADKSAPHVPAAPATDVGE